MRNTGNVGAELAAWRQSRGLSQAEAGKALAKFLPPEIKGVGQSAWSSWETGAKTPDLQNAIALSKMIDVPVDRLFQARRPSASKRKAA